MQSSRIILLLITLLLVLSACDGKKLHQILENVGLVNPHQARLPNQYKTIDWGMLSPDSFDPAMMLKNMDWSQIKDSDPRAIEALQKIKTLWDNAPVNPKLNKKYVKIAGYTAPLDTDLAHAKEFLLVPFFGACIHTPPPPSNQIIHVYVETPLSIVGGEKGVTVSGFMKTDLSKSSLGFASYRIDADIVDDFKN